MCDADAPDAAVASGSVGVVFSFVFVPRLPCFFPPPVPAAGGKSFGSSEVDAVAFIAGSLTTSATGWAFVLSGARAGTLGVGEPLAVVVAFLAIERADVCNAGAIGLLWGTKASGGSAADTSAVPPDWNRNFMLMTFILSILFVHAVTYNIKYKESICPIRAPGRPERLGI